MGTVIIITAHNTMPSTIRTIGSVLFLVVYTVSRSVYPPTFTLIVSFGHSLETTSD